MSRVFETVRILPFHRPIPLTPLPLILHRDHHFPYPSYGDNEPAPVPRTFRIVVLENEFLRVEIAPELGGRVLGLHDRRLGREILFANPVVKPVRYPPVGAFISGGIEFNFPIAHSPTSLAEVGCVTGQTGDYAFARVGEREARTGMEWVVELGLREGDPGLVQRTAFRNDTGTDHPWLPWTIAALRSTPGTEFVHPPQRVLIHGDRVIDTEWPGADLPWDRHHARMTALSWNSGDVPAFGVFHHDLGFGLMHAADPAQLPARKIWTYGHGRHRSWGEATTDGTQSYCEIESGPLPEDAGSPHFRAGTERQFEEFWIPVHARADADRVQPPGRALPPRTDPWLGWGHSPWQTGWERFRAGAGPLPDSPVPTGIELEGPLRRELARGNAAAAEPLALWLVFHGRAIDALPLLAGSPTPGARRLAGLIEWKVVGNPSRALPSLEAGPLHDPVAVAELDELYARLGMTAERAALLAEAGSHRLVVERRAALAFDLGQPRETLRLLAETRWPREHGRHVRTDLWRKACAALGDGSRVAPDSLHEDDLARGAADDPNA